MSPPAPLPVEEELMELPEPRLMPPVATRVILPPFVLPWLLMVALPEEAEIEEVAPPAVIDKLPPAPELFCKLTLPPRAMEPARVIRERLLPEVVTGLLTVRPPEATKSEVLPPTAVEVALTDTPLAADKVPEPESES